MPACSPAFSISSVRANFFLQTRANLEGTKLLLASMSVSCRFCSLNCQCSSSEPLSFSRLRLPLFSSNSLVHDGVGWVCVGKVETAIIPGQAVAAESSPYLTPSLGGRPGWELRCRISRVCRRDRFYAIWNSVSSRIIACMRMARRLASSTRTFLIFERAPIASVQVLSLRGPAHLVSITLAAS